MFANYAAGRSRIFLFRVLPLTIWLCGLAPVASAGTHQIPHLADLEFRNACGPIAAYSALTWYGVEGDLAEAARGCGYRDGSPVPLLDVLQYLRRFPDHLNVSSVKLTPDQLYEHLADGGTAIVSLEVYESEILHSVFLHGADRGFIVGTDYPAVHYQARLDNFGESWTGDALILKSPVRRQLPGFLIFSSVFFAVCPVLYLARWAGQRRSGRVTSAATVLMAAAIGTLSVDSYGSEAGGTGENATRTDPGELGSGRVTRLKRDLGVLDRGELVTIQYELRNSLSSTAKVKAVRQECGCFRLTEAPDEIASGQTVTVETQLSTANLAGPFERDLMVDLEVGEASTKKTVALRVLGSVRGVWFEPARVTFNVASAQTDKGEPVTLYQSGFDKTSDWSLKLNHETLTLTDIRRLDDQPTRVGSKDAVPVLSFRVAPAGSRQEVADISAQVRVSGPDALRYAPILRVAGTLTSQFDVSPRRLMLGRVAGSKEYSFEVDVSSAKDLKLADVRVISNAGLVTFEEPIRSGDRLVCRLRLNGKVSRGVLRDSAVVTWRDKRIAVVPVLAFVTN